MNDALLYIRAVKDSFRDKPNKFEEFLALLHGVNSNRSVMHEQLHLHNFLCFEF